MQEPGSKSVSVVIPTCNRAKVVERCIHALFAQTLKPTEIVVIDDGSRDETPETLSRLEAAHPEAHLVVLRNERNQGANASRNRGTRAAKGDLVAFLDSDCIPEPTWLEEMVRVFDEDETGAATGLVTDPAPRSIYDLTFRGTHRVTNCDPPRRVVAGNLCIRRKLLLDFMWYEQAERPPRLANGQPDVSYSGACDEEGLLLALRNSRWKLRSCPRAVVLHVHHYDRASFFRQAYYGGRAAAELVFRNRLPHRLDMLPFMLAWGTLPLAVALFPVLGWLPLAGSAFFFCVALAAITYNDLFLKRKTLWQTIVSYPVLVAYYHVRLLGYVRMTVALRTGWHKLPTAAPVPTATEEPEPLD
jgi:glycosyltransferase involved in cell wall biosynthesis